MICPTCNRLLELLANETPEGHVIQLSSYAWYVLENGSFRLMTTAEQLEYSR